MMTGINKKFDHYWHGSGSWSGSRYGCSYGSGDMKRAEYLPRNCSNSDLSSWSIRSSRNRKCGVNVWCGSVSGSKNISFSRRGPYEKDN